MSRQMSLKCPDKSTPEIETEIEIELETKIEKEKEKDKQQHISKINYKGS